MTRKRKSPGLDLVVFGTRLRISWTFPIAILVLGFHLRDRPVELVTLAVLLTTSVLVHESGHVVALRKFGHHPRVELGWLGGLTISEERRALTPTRSIIVSLAGPAFGIALGIIIEVMTSSFLPPERRGQRSQPCSPPHSRYLPLWPPT